MPRKGENIHKRKDGRWEGRYIRGRNRSGKAIYGYIYAKKYSEVKEKLTFLKGNYESLKVNTTNHFAKQNVTFTEASTAWLNTKKLKIKESSYVKYQNLIVTYIYPQLGEMPIETFNNEIISKFLLEQYNVGGSKNSGVSVSTIKSLLYLIKAILKYSESAYYSKPIPVIFELSSTVDSNIQVLDEDDEIRLVEYLLNDMETSKVAVLLCLITGLRIGEVCALKWNDINFKEQILQVHRTVQRLPTNTGDKHKTRLHISAPKSVKSIRIIPLPEFIMPIIQQFNNIASSDNFIITGKSNIPGEPRTLQKKFKKYLAEADIEYVNFHVLRHTFATGCIRLGFDIKTLSELLGHSDVQITLNRYVHSSMSQKHRQMILLNNNWCQNYGHLGLNSM